MVRSSIVFVGIAPHPPIMVPEVGGSASEEVRSSIEAMRELTQRVIASGAETVITISPHAPLAPRAFVAYQGDKLHGSFAGFGGSNAEIEADVDAGTLIAITTAALESGFEITPINGHALDHGTAVPLYFLLRNGWSGSVVSLGYTFLSNSDHIRFGACIRAAADAQGKPLAFIASGDLSHRLKPGAPAGFENDAHLFDELVVDAIRTGDVERIINLDPELRTLAGECGYRSMLVALGVTERSEPNYHVLSYEAPFGVGYLVAQLACEESHSRKNVAQDTRAQPALTSDPDLPALARLAVETFIRENRVVDASDLKLDTRAACFVSIKTRAGELRGCVGTIEPTKASLGDELIANAVHAATRDPRFPVVKAEELPNLRYSVDVLSQPEPATIDDLDSRIYGVIVEEEDSARRGVLLPDIAGVETVEQQVAIAMRKAGILPGSNLKLSRFRVSRFREATT